jgi:hypothetical protein
MNKMNPNLNIKMKKKKVEKNFKTETCYVAFINGFVQKQQRTKSKIKRILYGVIVSSLSPPLLLYIFDIIMGRKSLWLLCLGHIKSIFMNKIGTGS